jgi:glycerol-3-phosphate dehydrogenase
VIKRDPDAAAGREHDLIIVGGGIYGACLALEAARRGLRPLLLERGDFGEATSWNSLRILHGGLRYLQTLDIRRFRESVRERRWFCRNFPDLVRPLTCLMPLYGDGLKRPSVFRAALLFNDLLSWDRNAGVDSEKRIAGGRLLSVAETVSQFPLVDRGNLCGAGLWHDAAMVSSERLLIEILHWACSLGATALNYVEATNLVARGGRVAAVEARDALDGRKYVFSSRVVCNCAGPWSAELAGRFDRPIPRLFHPSLAFNVLLDCEPPSAAAVAVAARRPGEAAGPVYFLYPAFGRVLAGTVHAAWTGPADRPQPDDEQLQRFLADVNAAVPGLNVRREQIVRVFAGLLPVRAPGTASLSVRPVIRSHGLEGGPHGLVSVSGVKFTTARLVAEKTLEALAGDFGRLPVRSDSSRPRTQRTDAVELPQSREIGDLEIRMLRDIVREESVVKIDDLLLRRLNWAIAEPSLPALRRRVSEAIWGSDAGARLSGMNGRIDLVVRQGTKATA